MRECVRRYHPSNADFRRRHGLAWQSCAVAGVGRTADGMIDAVRSALYDGYAEWYDENIAPLVSRLRTRSDASSDQEEAAVSTSAAAPGFTSRR
jgi:hypothetical protein